MSFPILNPAPNLDVFVYTARDWRWSTFFTTGRWPLTSPPLGPENFPVEQLAGDDVLYFKLHGLAQEPRWYGVRNDVWQDALDLTNISQAPDLSGAVVFAQACYAETSPMIQALLDAGASAVVETHIKLTAGRWKPYQSDWLGRYFLTQLGQGKSVELALNRAHIDALANGHIPTDALTMHVAGNPERRFA